MTISRKLVAAAFALLATNASAQQPPLELKGIRLGVAKLADIKARFPGAKVSGSVVNVDVISEANARCKGGFAGAPASCRSKVDEDLSVAGEGWGDYTFSLDSNGVVGRAMVSFHERGFVNVRRALLDKYGTPTHVFDWQYKETTRIMDEDVVWVWERSDGKISLYPRRIGRSSDAFITMATIERLTREREAREKRAREAPSRL